MKRSRLTAVQRIVVDHIAATMENEGHDVEELVSLLQITEADIYERFKDRIWDLRETFTHPGLMGVGDSEEDSGTFYDGEIDDGED